MTTSNDFDDEIEDESEQSVHALIREVAERVRGLGDAKLMHGVGKAAAKNFGLGVAWEVRAFTKVPSAGVQSNRVFTVLVCLLY